MLARKLTFLVRRYLVSVVIGLTMSVATGPSATAIVRAQDGQDAFRTISAAELADMLVAKDFTFINVHVPFEGDIPQTDASIPFDHISENLNLLPADKDALIVLYCRSGRMSEIAAAELAALGYANVSHLAGGIIAWEEAGQPLQRSGAD